MKQYFSVPCCNFRLINIGFDNENLLGTLGNIFKGMNLTGSVHWPFIPFLYFLLGEWTWSLELQQPTENYEATWEKDLTTGGKKRKQATLWGPGPPTFLTSWDKYISWVFYCLQPNRIWRDPLLLLTALLRPLEIQLLHSVDNVEPSFEPDEHRNNGVRKIALVLMTNFGTSNVCVSGSVSLWSPGL